MDEEKKPERINMLTAAGMVVVAFILYLIGLIPGINLIIDGLAAVIFGFWFAMLGIGLMDAKRLATAGAGLIVEAIPILNVLPALVISVVAIIVMVKSEDKLGIKLPLTTK